MYTVKEDEKIEENSSEVMIKFDDKSLIGESVEVQSAVSNN